MPGGSGRIGGDVYKPAQHGIRNPNAGAVGDGRPAPTRNAPRPPTSSSPGMTPPRPSGPAPMAPRAGGPAPMTPTSATPAPQLARTRGRTRGTPANHLLGVQSTATQRAATLDSAVELMEQVRRNNGGPLAPEWDGQSRTARDGNPMATTRGQSPGGSRSFEQHWHMNDGGGALRPGALTYQTPRGTNTFVQGQDMGRRENGRVRATTDTSAARGKHIFQNPKPR